MFDSSTSPLCCSVKPSYSFHLWHWALYNTNRHFLVNDWILTTTSPLYPTFTQCDNYLWDIPHPLPFLTILPLSQQWTRDEYTIVASSRWRVDWVSYIIRCSTLLFLARLHCYLRSLILSTHTWHTTDGGPWRVLLTACRRSSTSLKGRRCLPWKSKICWLWNHTPTGSILFSVRPMAPWHCMRG